MKSTHSNANATIATLQINLTRTEKRLLYSLVGIQFFNVVDFMIMMPLCPMLARSFGINTAQFGVLISAYTFAGAVSGLLFATVADRFERRTLLLRVYALFILSTAACGFASSYEWLLFARACAGIFGGILSALINTVVADNVVPQRRGQAMGKVMTAFSLASVAGVPASLWLANHSDAIGWRAPFIAIACLACVLGAALHGEIPCRKPAPHIATQGNIMATLHRMKAVLSERNHLKALSLALLMTGAAFTVIPYLTIFATKNVGLPESKLPVLYFLGGAATLLSSPRIGRWADQFGKLKVFRTAALLSMVPVLLITHARHISDELYLAISTLFFILTNGRFVACQALISGASYAPVRGTFMGLYSCAMSLGLGLASLLGGLLIGTGTGGSITHFNWVGYVACTCAMLGIWLAGKVEQRA
jgi:predicted MFS family arabinose efflux permease